MAEEKMMEIRPEAAPGQKDNDPSGVGIPPKMKARRKTIQWNKKIFVCSPYRPKSKNPEVARQQLQDNITRARLACKYITSIGFMPMCPHLYFTGYLDDNDFLEREIGLEFAQGWLLEADELWVFGDEITEGMQGELETARNWDIPIRYQSEPALTVISLMNAIKGTGYERDWRRKIAAFETRTRKMRESGNAAGNRCGAIMGDDASDGDANGGDANDGNPNDSGFHAESKED